MAGPTYNFKPLSILLVDDAKPMVELLGSILKELGVGKVTAHGDAQKALALLDSIAPAQAAGTPMMQPPWTPSVHLCVLEIWISAPAQSSSTRPSACVTSTEMSACGARRRTARSKGAQSIRWPL